MVNNGSAAASPYATSIEVEKSSGSAFRSWEPRRTSSLAANTYYLLPTYELTDFVSENSAGTYTVTIKIDSRGSVSESSENDNSRVLKFSVTEPNVLTLGGSNRSFPAAAAKDKEVGVTANVSWTAKPSVPWLTVKTTGGKGNGKIVYNVAANNGAATRTGKITVAGGGLTRTYTVKQSGYEEILKLGGTSRSFSAAAAGGKEVGVTANVSWKAKSSVSWLTVKTTGGKGNGKIVYNVAANKGADRTGKITVTGTKKTVTYTVKQNGAGEILKLGGTSRSLPAAAAGGKEVAVTANVSWKAKSSASWLTLKTTGGKGNGKIVYSVAANKGSGTRTGKITVTGTKKTATYTVSQTAPTGANKYAVLVGINNYMYSNTLHQLQGCVNDSKYMESNLLAAGWPSANIKRLNDSQATKNAIRRAISNVSAKAVSGDTFVFMQSSHGGHPQTILTGNSGKAVYLCVYDENPNNDTTAYNDYELAKDLASFRSGVKVVVIVDACHAAGLFKSAAKAKSNPASFDIADRVSTLMDADRDARKTRGEKSAKGLSSSEIGWATAADYYEESSDKGFYHTDRWLTYGPDGNYYDPYSYKPGGAFLASATWGMWNGTADKNSTVGNRDGYCDAYEFWKSGYDACVRWWNYHPQCRNTNVLRSVKLGKSGSSLMLGASNRSFPAAAVTGKELAVAASVGWTAKSSVSWLTLKTASGTGNGKIVYNVAANTGSGTRTGKITVTGNGGKSATFTVTQGGKKSKSVAKAATAAGRVWVTTSDGQPGDAVADGNEETGWTPEGTGGAWVALTFEEARCVGSVVVKGKSLPEGMRVLVSEDGDDWSEEGSEAASYLWVVLPDEGTKPTITEIESEP